MPKDVSAFVRKCVQHYSQAQITFLKNDYQNLFARIRRTETQVKTEILGAINLVFAEQQQVYRNGAWEIRYCCYPLYSENEGRCYVLRFNSALVVVTMFPLGRKTLAKYRKRFIGRGGIG